MKGEILQERRDCVATMRDLVGKQPWARVSNAPHQKLLATLQIDPGAPLVLLGHDNKTDPLALAIHERCSQAKLR